SGDWSSDVCSSDLDERMDRKTGSSSATPAVNICLSRFRLTRIDSKVTWDSEPRVGTGCEPAWLLHAAKFASRDEKSTPTVLRIAGTRSPPSRSPWLFVPKKD